MTRAFPKYFSISSDDWYRDDSRMHYTQATASTGGITYAGSYMTPATIITTNTGYCSNISSISWVQDEFVFSQENREERQREIQRLREADIAARAAMLTRSNENSRLRITANERAETLLKLMLSEDQLKQYEKSRSFEVVKRTLLGVERRYLITHGIAGNIFLLDGAKRVEKYCIHIDGSMPACDNLISQKLLLETDEQQFLSIANRTRIAA